MQSAARRLKSRSLLRHLHLHRHLLLLLHLSRSLVRRLRLRLHLLLRLRNRQKLLRSSIYKENTMRVARPSWCCFFDTKTVIF